MIEIDPAEVEFSAIHLRFDIRASSLPQELKERLLALGDQRISGDGVVVIKAQTSRSQDMNRQDALQRLQALVDSVAVAPPLRRPTPPPYRAPPRPAVGQNPPGQEPALADQGRTQRQAARLKPRLAPRAGRFAPRRHRPSHAARPRTRGFLQ